ncbi:MAG: Tn3 family transposase, partial [Deltaproteobacteria bacterium]|nr:Tn3 family transposase [Deltaproteobacteria bacterium]
LLSSLYNTCKNEDQQAYCDLIKRLSPVAWQHINLIGKYEFCQNYIALNIQELIETMLLNSEINFSSKRQA